MVVGLPLVHRQLFSPILKIVHPQRPIEPFAVGAVLSLDLAGMPRRGYLYAVIFYSHFQQRLLEHRLVL